MLTDILETSFLKYLFVGFMSMVPVIELRGAVPVGLSLGLPIWRTLAVCVICNTVPVPFIILFIRKIFQVLRQRSEKMRRLVEKLETRAEKKGKMLYKYQILGLYVLVAIPLPGTGAWTGSLVAALFRLRLKVALPVIFLGVLTAGVLTCAISYGIFTVAGG